MSSFLLCDFLSHDDFDIIKSGKSGIFLQIFLPIFFKNYVIEENFLTFLLLFQLCYNACYPCYEYLIKLNNEMIEMFMHISEKKIEINEEIITRLIFLWSIINKEQKKEKEIECLIRLTVKVFEFIGNFEEEKKEEVKEKDNEQKNKENKNVKEMKEIANRKKMIMYRLLDIIDVSINRYSHENREKVKKDGRIVKILLEKVKNHLKSVSCLIEKGDRKRIIEYIIYSYDKDIKKYYLLSVPSYSFPFSFNTIIQILYYTLNTFMDDDYKVLKKKDILFDLKEVFRNYLDILKIIDEYDAKKEIERELSVVWNKKIINELKMKVSLNRMNVTEVISSLLKSYDFSFFKIGNSDIIKRFISIHFSHSNNNVFNDEKEKEKEKDNRDINNITLIRPFIVDEVNREGFIMYFIFNWNNYHNYSISDFHYLSNNSKEGCNIINILMKELSGEIVDRIIKRKGKNLRKERRRYERERYDDKNEHIFLSLKNMLNYTYEDRNRVLCGIERKKDSYVGKEKKIKEEKEYISDVIEEEDMRECLVLYLKTVDENNYCSDLSIDSHYIKSLLSYI